MKKILSIILAILLLLGGCASADIDSDNQSYYYLQLSSAQKKIYNQLDSIIESYETTAWVMSDVIDSKTALYAYVLDNPQYFWCSKSDYFYRYLFDFMFYIDITDEDIELIVQQYQQVLDIAYEIIAQTENMSDYDRLKYFHDYIIENTKYTEGAQYNQDVRSVLLNHESVCAGYAKTFQLLCQLSGYECYYVTGVSDSDSGSQNHGWNIVNLNGNYYNVDCTFDELIDTENNEYGISYNYFMVSDLNFKKNHTPQNNYDLKVPECTDDSLNYYSINNCLFDSFDINELSNYILNQLENENETIYFKFVNQNDYLNALTTLFINNGTKYGNGFSQIIRQNFDNTHKLNYLMIRDDANLIIQIINIEFK